MITAAIADLVDVIDLQNRLSAIVDVRSRAAAFRILAATFAADQDRAAGEAEADQVLGDPGAAPPVRGGLPARDRVAPTGVVGFGVGRCPAKGVLVGGDVLVVQADGGEQSALVEVV